MDLSVKQSKSKRSLPGSRASRYLDNDASSGRLIEVETDLPPALRARLYDLFGQIEREFEALYSDNVALQEKLDQLTGVSSEKTVQSDTQEESSVAARQLAAVKKSGSQISQRLKLTYKSSTSKIVSSFKNVIPACQLVREFRGHRDGVWEVNVSHTDPQVIGTASADHVGRLWWVETGACLLQYAGHSGSVNSLRFHPSQELVLTASGDQTAHIWKGHISPPSHVDAVKCHSSEDELEGSEKEDIDGVDSSDDRHDAACVRQPLLELQGHSSVVIAADWLAQGSQVITASWDRMAHLHDAETGEIINSLSGHDQELTNVSCHPTQALVATSSKDTTFRLWDFRDPALNLHVFQGHTQPVTSAVFAGGDNLVSGSDDRTVKVWDLKHMRSPITTIRTDSAVNRLAVSGSQHLIAIPQDNRHTRLYDMQGVRVARLSKSNRQGHSRMVCCACWSERDNATCDLYTCGFDRLVFGWTVALNKE